MGHLNIFLICLSGLPHICAKISSQNCLSATLPVQIHGPSGSSPGHWSQQRLRGSGLPAGRSRLQVISVALPPQGHVASMLRPGLACPQGEGAGLSPEAPHCAWHDQSISGVTGLPSVVKSGFPLSWDLPIFFFPLLLISTSCWLFCPLCECCLYCFKLNCSFTSTKCVFWSYSFACSCAVTALRCNITKFCFCFNLSWSYVLISHQLL